jgi:hypothetical protein
MYGAPNAIDMTSNDTVAATQEERVSTLVMLRRTHAQITRAATIGAGAGDVNPTAGDRLSPVRCRSGLNALAARQRRMERLGGATGLAFDRVDDLSEFPRVARITGFDQGICPLRGIAGGIFAMLANQHRRGLFCVQLVDHC